MRKKQSVSRAVRPLLCVLDFDGVLFDDRTFKKAHQKEFRRYNVSSRLYRDTYNETKQLTGGRYASSIHYALISRCVPLLSRALLHKKSAMLVKQSRRYLYADAKPFLRWCRKSGIALALVSTGSSFQKKKVSTSGLAPFFGKIIVTKDVSKVAGMRIVIRTVAHRQVVFVDDKPAVLNDIKKKLPEVYAVQMRRHTQEVSEQTDARVHSFSGVKKIFHAIETKSAS